jgi:hypothetical protein
MASVDDVKLRKCSAGQHAESRTRADSTVLFDIQTGANIRPGQADQVLGRGTADQGPLVFPGSLSVTAAVTVASATEASGVTATFTFRRRPHRWFGMHR